jgi:hypothetical protein
MMTMLTITIKHLNIIVSFLQGQQQGDKRYYTILSKTALGSYSLQKIRLTSSINPHLNIQT